MTEPLRTAPPAGWYPDPQGLPQQRWWTGTQWSRETQPLPGAVTPEPAATPVTYTPTFLPSRPVESTTPPVAAQPIAAQPVVAQPIATSPASTPAAVTPTPFATPAVGGAPFLPPTFSTTQPLTEQPYAAQPYAGIPSAPAARPQHSAPALPATPSDNALPTRRQLRERAEAAAAAAATFDTHTLAPFAMPAAGGIATPASAPVASAPVTSVPVTSAPLPSAPVVSTESAPLPVFPANPLAEVAPAPVVAAPAPPEAHVLPSRPMSASELFPERFPSEPTPEPPRTAPLPLAAPAATTESFTTTPAAPAFPTAPAASFAAAPAAAASPFPAQPSLDDILAGRPAVSADAPGPRRRGTTPPPAPDTASPNFSATVATLGPGGAAPAIAAPASAWAIEAGGAEGLPYEPFGMVPKVSSGVAEPSSTVYTVAGWLLAFLPVFVGAAYYAVLTLLASSYTTFMQVGIAFIFVLLSLALASRDSQALKAAGHQRPAGPAWVLLSSLVYLIVRTVRVKSETGRGGILLLVWLMLVVALGAAAYLLVPADLLHRALVPGSLF